MYIPQTKAVLLINDFSVLSNGIPDVLIVSSDDHGLSLLQTCQVGSSGSHCCILLANAWDRQSRATGRSSSR